ncbi:hypothetical protein VT50_0215835 [Streptomyces antioxidans]|uniref:Uncharacterized protein n=1 Tax=Streptomyces antioxidans TaxID=1507734 RepID=A0A1V4D526_9ACTN|nr:hypothetical protein [Streptomyces antioxidans]OPF79530.1 hypothetical protein VT50_0215835 [Streptomyces antioxidans]
MSEYHYVFMRPGQPREQLISDISFACGANLKPVDSEFVDYAANLGHAAVEVEFSHEYEKSYGIPFEEYDSLLSIRDFDSDLVRQESLARRIFGNLASLERYALLLVLDLQVQLDAKGPADGGGGRQGESAGA